MITRGSFALFIFSSPHHKTLYLIRDYALLDYGTRPRYFAACGPILYLSPMDSNTLIVLCTCPDQESAEHIAHQLVKNRLAACVNISSPIKSVYRWQGEIETEDEFMLFIKTSATSYDELEQAIMSMHPYELPAVVAIPVERGQQNYLGWITQCTSS
jgi:periplasmic divalent cation tolerance protein